MIFTIDLDQEDGVPRIVAGLGVTNPITLVQAIRGTAPEWRVRFQRDGVPYLPPGISLSFMFKESLNFDGPALVSATGADWSTPDDADGFFIANPNFNTDELNELLFSPDANPANDVAELIGMGAFSWRVGSDAPTETERFIVRAANKVINGDEAAPVPGGPDLLTRIAAVEDHFSGADLTVAHVIASHVSGPIGDFTHTGTGGTNATVIRATATDGDYTNDLLQGRDSNGNIVFAASVTGQVTAATLSIAEGEFLVDAAGKIFAPALDVAVINGITVTTSAGSTLALAAGSSLTTAGAYAHTFTFTGASTLTFPTSGTLATNPMTTAGDIIIGGASGVSTRLPAGTNGHVLTMVAGSPAYAAPSMPAVAPAFVPLTDGATITITCDATKAVQNSKVTLGGNRTLAISGAANGMTGILFVTQDATGSRTLALPAGSKVTGAGTGTMTLTPTASAIDVLAWIYDGANYIWTKSLNAT